MRAPRDLSVPDRMPVARNRVLGRPTRSTWPALALAAALGAGLWALFGDPPGRAVGSYLAAWAAVVACFGMATMMIRIASRISPGTMFLAAMLSYAFTIAVLSFAWLLADPAKVDGAAVLTGAVAAVVVWVTGVVRNAWVR
ncbi:hypothetical protein [Jatrophihabitans fulvus]